MKFLSILKTPWLARGSRPYDDGDEREAWLRDPLSHPVLDRMSPTELADLPLRQAPVPHRDADGRLAQRVACINRIVRRGRSHRVRGWSPILRRFAMRSPECWLWRSPWASGGSSTPRFCRA